MIRPHPIPTRTATLFPDTTLFRSRPQVDAGAIGGFAESVLHLRVQRRELGEHADGLRSLAWDDEGERIGHGRATDAPLRAGVTGMIKALFRACLYPGVCRSAILHAQQCRAPGYAAAEGLPHAPLPARDPPPT